MNEGRCASLFCFARQSTMTTVEARTRKRRRLRRIVLVEPRTGEDPREGELGCAGEGSLAESTVMAE